MTLKITKLLFLALFIYAMNYGLMAQNPFIQNYTSYEGLPSNNVYQIYQDSKRFIWFATDAGVARFDGSVFIHFSKHNGLSCNDVVRIKEDSRGRIWFFNMDATLNFYKDGIMYNGHNTPFLDSLTTIELFRNFFEDSDRTIYFFNNRQREIYTLDSNNYVHKQKFKSVPILSPSSPIPVETMDFRHLQRASDGWLYMFTITGLFRFRSFPDDFELVQDSVKYKFVFAEPGENSFIVSGGSGNSDYDIWRLKDDIHIDNSYPPLVIHTEFVSSVFEDSDGYVWISTFDMGVFCYQGNHLIRHLNITDAQSVMQDHEGNIWISSLKDGVFKINPNLNQQVHYGRNNFDDKEVLALTNHIQNGVWISNGNKIFLLQDKNILGLDFQNEQNNLNQILQIDENTLVAGALGTRHYSIEGIREDQSGKKIIYSNKIISPRPYRKLIMNKPGSEILTWNFFTVIQMEPRLFDHARYMELGERVFSVFLNSKNQIIVNARQMFELQDGALIRCGPLSRFDGRIISDHMVIEDSLDVLNVEGDTIFIQAGNQFYNLTASWDYPIDLNIRHLEYYSPTLLVATSRKVYFCEFPEKIIEGEPVVLQMLDIRFRNIHDILFHDDLLYIASDDGLTVFSSASLKSDSVSPPLPYFRFMQINGTEQSNASNQITLTGRNKIMLAFGSINFSSSPAIYSYMLDGLDEGWQTDRGNTVVYENLQKGEYIFKLKARKPTSAWSKPIEYRIRIKASFWQQPIFYIILCFIAAGLGIILITWRKNLQIKKKDIEHQLVLLEQRALQAMMNPHFIFNSLGSIQNYLLQNKPSEASHYLSQFARLIRQNLNSSSAAIINLGDEINRLKNYLDLEQMRMEHKFEYEIKIDPAINPQTIMIPSMVIQPFVENSIWHGIPKLHEPGKIEISFHLKDKKSIKISIKDNGSGIKKESMAVIKSGKYLAKGMAMTQKRLDLLSRKYNLPTGVVISEVKPGEPFPGTLVEIVVPYAHAALKEGRDRSGTTG